MAPTLYFDLASPYAYLAAERAERVLGEPVDFQPVLAGAIFAMRGHGSWAHTPARDENVAEVERRAVAYGLPPVAWPPGWPGNSLHAMRVAVLARRAGRVRDFALAAFRRAFVDGDDLSDPAIVTEVAAATGVAVAIDQSVKHELRAVTEAAYARGVIGVPCVEIGGVVRFGDDQLPT